jgi:hypothetical protein
MAVRTGVVGGRAAIFIGPEFGTLTQTDITAAAREAAAARFDTLITCAFSYDAHASELTRLGPLPILKARMNPDLHMAGDLNRAGPGHPRLTRCPRRRGPRRVMRRGVIARA